MWSDELYIYLILNKKVKGIPEPLERKFELIQQVILQCWFELNQSHSNKPSDRAMA